VAAARLIEVAGPLNGAEQLCDALSILAADEFA